MLSERQRMILTAIVDDYIRSAEPVGSRSISKRGDVAFSPATIRNEMADLEELGLLEQPHTSAGRIPSIKGYRYYVDHLIRVGGIGEQDVRKIRGFLAEKMNMWEEVVSHTATILSQLTNYTSIVLGPETFNTTLKHFQLVPINETSAVAIIVTSTGHVEHKTVTLPEGVGMNDIQKIVNLLNDKLAGVAFVKVKSVLHAEVGKELSRIVDSCEHILQMLESTLADDQEPRIFLSGATNIMTQPEFKDVDKVKNILDMLEETPKLMQLFQAVPDGIQVRIGTENALEAINQCSLITANYSYEGQSLGTIGILGPTRMDYGKVISLLDYLSKDLALFMARRHK
ncbi:heat-inducible transcriptional repressor HrcA [Cohnella lubricantis]|uniref:Heat-inducible transcription repressor HrcA n=1 Tax=Cohnella lubricantis TaxID=2163172 RepID=A0A841TBF8_9BACL|nr:heat-inducible transcriptional repressor HrcA [Cohnella lubricantis]MBB6675761.1 heat-inducible transcription repressor HrcA [Cohnella lubricantis]MBP2119835.1 heat-inducible transcriptional repressor [Cohnella lubricantis]